MKPLIIEETQRYEIPFVYAATYIREGDCEVGVFASEGREGKCVLLRDGNTRLERVWESPGGTMTVCTSDNQGGFYAVQQFFPVFDSRKACVVSAKKENGKWSVKKILDVPYVHRFDVVDTRQGRFLLISQLTRNKKERTDWSQPGSVYAVALDEKEQPVGEPVVLIDRLFKNHGYFRGVLNGSQVAMVSGTEGLYGIYIDPEKNPAYWEIRQLVDHEVSDVAIYDMDQDGRDELVTIEGFHGDNLFVYKETDGSWKQVYRYSIHFGHALWAGDIFGSPAILIGYRREDCALKLLRKEPNCWCFEETVLSTELGPTNVDVRKKEQSYEVLCAGRTMDVGVIYRITE